MQRWSMLLLGIVATGCASGDPDAPPAEPTYEEIFVSKNDVNRAAVDLEVQAIQMRPGESVEDALRRAGYRSGSFSQLVDEARRAGPNPGADAVPESDAPRAPETDAPDPACNDTCVHANDGICDDGTDPNGTDACDRGTDCTDCRGNAAPEGGQGGAGGAGGQGGFGGEGGAGEGGAGEGGAGGEPQEPAPEEPAPEEPAPEEPAPEEPAPEEPDPQMPDGELCNDSCNFAHDGACDDGRPGAPFSVCARGTDCTDCNQAAGQPAPMPPAEEPVPDGSGQICVANGRDGVCGPVDDCNGTPVPGFCRGARNIQCCLPAGANPPPANEPAAPEQCLAMGRPGVCIATSDCDGASVPGHCRGAAHIQCCVQNEQAPPAEEPQAPQQCLAMGEPGVCKPTAECDGASVPGHCRGAANIQCCIANRSPAPEAEQRHPAEGQACLASGRPGVCENTATCEGSSFPGHCDGPDNIRCCVPDAVEEKALCGGLCIAAGLLVVRGAIFFATRAGPRVAQRAVVGAVRQSPGNAQVVMRATNDAMLLAGTATIVGSQVLNGEPGAITQNWVGGLARSGTEEESPAVPDTNALPTTNLCRGRGTELDQCVLQKRAEQGPNVTLEGGRRACSSGRAEQLAAQKDAACDSVACQRLGSDPAAQQASRNWLRLNRLNNAETEALYNFCSHNRSQLARRDQCIAARQQVIDECYPGRRGDETHRCEICAQMGARQNCQTNIYVAAGCDTFMQSFGM